MNSSLEMDGGMLQEVQQFCYMGDVLDSKAKGDRLLRARVASVWLKWKEIASLLMSKSIPRRHRGIIFAACITSSPDLLCRNMRNV